MPINPAILSKAGPSFNLNFLSGTLDSRLTFTRAATAWAYDSTGTLRSFTTDTPRFDYGTAPGGVTNWLRNNSMTGAVIGTPGTNPTNWIVGWPGGISPQIVSLPTVSGMPGIRYSITGTPGAAAGVVQFDAVSAMPVAQGSAWTGSMYVQLNSGSFTTGFASFDMSVREYDISQSFLRQTLTSMNSISSLTRLTSTITAGNGTYFIVLSIRITGLATIPSAVDFTLAGMQLEQSASAGAVVQTTSAAVNVGAIPLGLQFEEARTNSIRNNSNTGTVLGTPGTLPTNWTVSGLGATTSVIAFGTENGIPYCDVQFNGTTTSAGQIAIGFESPAVTAVAAQLWTGSAFLRLISGTFTNVTALGLQVNVTGGTGSVRTSATPTSASLASQRITTVVTAGTGTTGVNLFFVGTVASGVAINFTIRCGAPCLELGSFVTSPILTTTVAVTRAVDNASMPLGSWFNPSGFSAICVGLIPVLNGASNMILYEFDDGVSARVMLYVAGGAVGLFDSVGALNFTVIGANVVINTAFKLAGGFGNVRQAGAANGSVVTAGAATLPVVTTLRFGSNQGSGTAQRYSGYVQSLTVWPRVLADSELRALSRQ